MCAPVGDRTVAGSTAVRAVTIGLLIGAYVALGVYFHRVLGTGIVYTHAGYVPIVLAGIWWGRRGLAVACVVAAVPVLLRLLGFVDAPVWTDAARIASFLAVAIAAAELSEQVKRGQRALRASQEQYRLIVEKSLAGILVYRDEGILFANSRIGEMLGYAPENMAGMSVWDLVAEQDAPKVRQMMMRRKEEGVSDLQYECRLIRADGTLIWVDIASSAADFEYEPAVLVNAYDITNRKEAEAKRRELADLTRRQEEELIHSARLAELGEMSAAVAHDLNQPLTGIKNFASNALYMLEEGVGDTEQVRSNLERITEQVHRASRIINQMRDMTRKSERCLVPLQLNEIIGESVEFLRPQLRLASVKVILELAEDLPRVMGDRARLEQVFLNLLTNARQAMEEAETRHLTVRTHATGDSVVSEVEDTGRGFPADEGAELFAAFYSTKERGHGTGLGLTISRRIIKDHGGTIEAHGEPGKGARFTIRMPLPENAETQRALHSDARDG